MNGDVLTNPLYGDLVAAHATSGAAATIATRLQTIDVDYGVLDLDAPEGDSRRILRIDEKPRFSWPVSMGIYAFEPRVLEFVAPNARMDFPELISRLIAAGELVTAYEHAGYWMDIGQLHHLEAAVRDYEGDAEDFAYGTQIRMLNELVSGENGDVRSGE